MVSKYYVHTHKPFNKVIILEKEKCASSTELTKLKISRFVLVTSLLAVLII